MLTGRQAVVLTALVLVHGIAGDTLDDCKQDPTMAKCADTSTYYNLAAVEADVESLCMMMPQMPSCGIRKLCTAGTIAEDSGHCGAWNFLSGVCSTAHGENMQGMAGCATYKMICVEDSVVLSCTDSTKQGPDDLITTAEVQDAAVDYCQQNPDIELDIIIPEAGNMDMDMDMDNMDNMDNMDMNNRRDNHKACEMCDSLKCNIALDIVAHACQDDKSPSYCTELKGTCDANEGLKNVCYFGDESSGGSTQTVQWLFSAVAAVVTAAIAL